MKYLSQSPLCLSLSLSSLLPSLSSLRSLHSNVPAKVHNGVLKFRVRDQDHALGAVHLTIPELTKQSSKQWYPILPSKKSQEAVGELLIEYSIKEYRPYEPKNSPVPSHSTSQEDIAASKSAGSVGGASGTGSGGGGAIGGKGRFSFHRRTPSWSKSRTSASASSSDRSQSVTQTPDLSPSPTHDKRLTGSDIELHSKPPLVNYQSDSNLRGYSLYDSSGDRSPEQTAAHQEGDDKDEKRSLTPEVTGISPREGPVEGGQRVVLRGSNLGEFKSDIVKVVIAGVDCTSSLEYFSPCKQANINYLRPADMLFVAFDITAQIPCLCVDPLCVCGVNTMSARMHVM